MEDDIFEHQILGVHPNPEIRLRARLGQVMADKGPDQCQTLLDYLEEHKVEVSPEQKKTLAWRSALRLFNKNDPIHKIRLLSEGGSHSTFKALVLATLYTDMERDTSFGLLNTVLDHEAGRVLQTIFPKKVAE